MKPTEHTPGPWTSMVDAGGIWRFVTAPAPNGGEHRITVANCPHPKDAFHDHQRIANARLIAAAPDLLEAAKAARAFISLLPDWFDARLRELQGKHW